MQTPPDNKTPFAPARVIVAVSGSGRSLENFLHWQDKLKTFKICGVISSNPTCRAGEIAKLHGLPLHQEKFTGSLTPSPDLCAWLGQVRAEWIALAGFLKVFPTDFSAGSGWKDRIINIHPSLLPHFAGKNMYGNRVHAAVLQARVPESGASVHFVNERYDEGQVIAQVKISIENDDDVEILAKRIFQAECFLYPNTLSGLISGTLPLKNGEIFQYHFVNNASIDQRSLE